MLLHFEMRSIFMAYKFRKFILLLKSHYWEIYITYLLAWFSQAISPNFVGAVIKLFKIGSLGTIFLYIFTVLGILILIFDEITKRIVFAQRIEPEFDSIMKRHTDDKITDKGVGNTGGGFSWGMDRTVVYCKDLINGWKPEDIQIAAYDDNMYRMKSAEEAEKGTGISLDWENLYKKFEQSDKYKRIIDRGNNLPRFMLTRCEMNYNKERPQLFLSLKRTDWCQCTCTWDYFRKDYNSEAARLLLQKQLDNKFKSSYLPNSLCLHLLIETDDGKVVISTISQYKENDYPNTFAATLGEQIEFKDFNDGQSFHEPFLKVWTRRAFMEEFGLSADQYKDLVDQDSIRVLSVDMEGDIYNFTIMCVVKLTCSINIFHNEIACTIESKEIATIKALDVNSIPRILVGNGNAEERKLYHPSTYLRLLMFYLHKNGIKRTQRALIAAEKNYRKSQ